MADKAEGVSATVIAFPAQRRERAFTGTFARASVQPLRPILSSDGWYHEAAMREDARPARLT